MFHTMLLGGSVKRSAYNTGQVTHQSGTYFQLHEATTVLVNRRVAPALIFASPRLNIWVERDTVSVKCFVQKQNTTSPPRAGTRTAQFGDKLTNHESTAPSFLGLEQPAILSEIIGLNPFIGAFHLSHPCLTSQFYT